MTPGEAETLARLESEVLEIKEMLRRLEAILIGEEEITEEDRKLLEKRLQEARAGETVSLEELLRGTDVQG